MSDEPRIFFNGKECIPFEFPCCLKCGSTLTTTVSPDGDTRLECHPCGAAFKDDDTGKPGEEIDVEFTRLRMFGAPS